MSSSGKTHVEERLIYILRRREELAVVRFKLRRRPRSEGRGGTPSDPTEAVLAEADALCDQCRAMEAVHLVTDANRRLRDPRLERRLVNLRAAAFVHLVPPATPPAWPNVVEDLWAGVRIPEISARELSVEALRSGISNHGSLIVRGLLDHEPVEQLTGDIERALAAYDEHVRGTAEPEFADWYEPYGRDTVSVRPDKRDRGSIMTYESPPALFDLLEVFGQVGIDRLVRNYFGESPGILARKATLRRVAPAKDGGVAPGRRVLGKRDPFAQCVDCAHRLRSRRSGTRSRRTAR